MNALTNMNDIRRANLRKLVTKYEGMNGLARQLGLTRGAYISQLLMENPVRVISEKTARQWEAKLSLPTGWLDGVPVGQQKGEPAPVNTHPMSSAIEVTLEGLKNAGVKLPSARTADLITMLYTDAVTIGQVDVKKLDTILALLKP